MYRVASADWDAGPGLTGQGQAHLKRGLSGARIHVDGALMRANDAENDIESETGAFAYRFGGEKRFKNAVTDFRRYARAVVREFHQHVLGLQTRTNGESLLAIGLGIHRADGIIDQIRPDLI